MTRTIEITYVTIWQSIVCSIAQSTKEVFFCSTILAVPSLNARNAHTYRLFIYQPASDKTLLVAAIANYAY
jgi:hypothetical protein